MHQHIPFCDRILAGPNVATRFLIQLCNTVIDPQLVDLVQKILMHVPLGEPGSNVSPQTNEDEWDELAALFTFAGRVSIMVSVLYIALLKRDEWGQDFDGPDLE